MIYLTPSLSCSLPTFRRSGLLLFAVPLCVLLASCDSASSSTNELSSQTSPVDTVESAPLKASLESTTSSDDLAEATRPTEGQSLIASAQSSRDAHLSTPSAESGSSTLQATLMGDYGGMVACTTCDSIDVTLNLFADGSVLKTSIYNNPEKPQTPLLESGIYRQDDNTITIVYEDKAIENYQIQDNHLVLMDDNKQPNNDYTLARK